LEDGRNFAADFFIDASGFRSELIGKALAEPYVSFDRSLFCDRAVVGGWERGPDEPILPYTTAEAMDFGWAWQIEHEQIVNRGYVYSSNFISDDQAAEEFLRKNPKAPKSPRVVKFRSGCYQRQWVENVVAIGNSGGFVEPLEATALMIVCSHIQNLIGFLQHTRLTPTPTIRDLFNQVSSSSWYDIRDFLALHYKLNTASQSPFWDHCRNETDVSRIAPLLEFYRQNGPTGFGRHLLPRSENDFGLEGYLVMLVGNRAPYEPKYQPTADERARWEQHRAAAVKAAENAMTVKEALAYVRHPNWQWHGDVTPAPPTR
jgi:tryptophan 7-halogenase